MYDHDYKSWTISQLIKEHHAGARFQSHRDTADFELVKRLLKLNNNLKRENKLLRQQIAEIKETGPQIPPERNIAEISANKESKEDSIAYKHLQAAMEDSKGLISAKVIELVDKWPFETDIHDKMYNALSDVIFRRLFDREKEAGEYIG